MFWRATPAKLTAEAMERLEMALASHGVAARVERGQIFAGSSAPPIQAEVVSQRRQEESLVVQLDIRVQLPGGRTLIESFAGWGDSPPDALNHAFANFAQNSLHVLLAAFYRQPDSQITVEEWRIGNSSWTALIGNFGAQSSVEAPPIPDPLFEVIEAAIREEPLTQTLHWFRVFYCNPGAGDPVCETLFDNQPWPRAQKRVAQLPWERLDSYYSVRNFLILKRDDA